MSALDILQKLTISGFLEILIIELLILYYHGFLLHCMHDNGHLYEEFDYIGMLLQHSEENADSYWKGAFLADGGGDGKAVEDRVDACILLFVMMIINCS